MPYVPRKKTNRRPRRRVSKKPAKPSKSFVKKVQSIIHKNVENKQAFHTLDLTAFNSGINAVGDAIRILPNISNGNSDHSRIGDQLRGMTLNVKGHMISTIPAVYIGTSIATNARIAVRMMVVQPRSYSQIDSVQSNATTWMSTLLKKGATTTNFTGTISDLYAPINSDAIIKYYDKVMYLPLPTVQFINSGVVGATNVNGPVASDVASSCKFFNLSLRVKNKLLKYDTTGSSTLQPMNYAPTFILGYVKLDGSSPDTVSTQVSCAFDAMFQYEDA
jgi:hypothetical protein